MSSYLVQIGMKIDMGIAQIIQIFSMFFGPLMAFLVAIRIYKHQKREENLANLNFAIASLSSLLNNLYLMKDKVVRPKYREVERIEAVLVKRLVGENQIRLNVDQLLENILDEQYKWPIKNETLNFIAKLDPNIILILGVSMSSISTFEGIITRLNQHIEDSRKNINLKEEDVLFNISMIKNLYSHLDNVLYLLNKSLSLLEQSGKREFGNKFKIELASEFNIALVDIEPPVIESWERVDWLPVREKRFQKFVAYLGFGHGAI